MSHRNRVWSKGYADVPPILRIIHSISKKFLVLIFCYFIFSSSWEERHGAATALREIILVHGSSAGFSEGQSFAEMEKAHAQWMHSVAFELLIVLARDR